jgi:DNA-binding PadR family transcriptional regulator
MERETDNRTNEYEQSNDRLTFMTDMQKCLKKLEEQGYTDQYRVEKGKLHSLTDPKKYYKPSDLHAVNFYRFEGITDPDDMSILYAVETSDGRKGTLIDAYGSYADEETGAFMQEVDIHKKVSKRWSEQH